MTTVEIIDANDRHMHPRILALQQANQSNHDAIMAKIETLVQSIESVRTSLEMGVKAVSMVPVALAFLGVSTWLRFQNKIAEWSWMMLMLVLLSPFFGEGVRRAMSRIAPVDADKAARAAQIIIATFAVFSIVGEHWA